MSAANIRYHRPPGLEGVELLHLSDPDFGFAPHVHDAYVFWFNGSGGERVSLGGASDILQPDSFGVVAPGEVHANHPVTEHRTLQSLYVDAEAIDDLLPEHSSMGFRSRLQRDRQSRELLARLHAVLMHSDDSFLSRQTFAGVFSVFLERHGERPVSWNDKPAPDKVIQARRIMRERFAEALDLDDLADECGCTVPHLIRLFKRETGMTPHAYLMEQRLACAREQLLGDTPVSAIAFSSGFTDQSHLTRRFTARFGLPPGRYRRQVRS